jgi:hypothetical protein
MNGGLQYFTRAMVSELLERLKGLVTEDVVILFTDVPDAGKLLVFYDTPERIAEFERRVAIGTEAIGTWWERQDLGVILEQAGYSTIFLDQDPRRYTQHYRFDVLARRSVK